MVGAKVRSSGHSGRWGPVVVKIQDFPFEGLLSENANAYSFVVNRSLIVAFRGQWRLSVRKPDAYSRPERDHRGDGPECPFLGAAIHLLARVGQQCDSGLPLIILRASNVRVLPRSTRGGFRPAE